MDSPGRVVRLGHSLNEAERQHVSNRRATVQQCLQKHNIPCSLDEVPNIAVLGSGGGERAMIGLLGSLSQLGEEGLLDCIMYLSGVSGSTWCMSSVYKEPDWSTKMETLEQNIIQRLVSGHVSQSEQYKKLMEISKRDNFSMTDIWALWFVCDILNEIDEHVVTDYRGQHTKDPYPIYTVVDQQCKHDKAFKDVWFEITPDECGYSLTGAFVDSSAWESRFENGAVTKKQRKNDMLYLQGLCGSALADKTEIKKAIIAWLLDLFHGDGVLKLYTSDSTEEEEVTDDEMVMSSLLELNDHFFRKEEYTNDITKINKLLEGKHDKEGNEVKLEGPITEEILKNYCLKVCDCLSDWFPGEDDFNTTSELQADSIGLLKIDSRLTAKCMKKVHQWDWGTTYNFLYKMTASEVHPSILKSETRKFVDAGVLVNSPFFAVLRKERNVDLIISFDFGDLFGTVDRAAEICEGLQIPFPTLKHPAAGEQPVDFYVCNDNSEAPTVIHIPLFNDVNCKGEVEKLKIKYQTFQFTYTENMISDLLDIARLNIKNTKEKLLNVIKDVVQRKKKH
ncbi:cytosolic phospholipase A2 gamma-like [Brachyhypopomus gauderio]|uniref:cytosolic phospholipase A2 gamma-like n=1 Tax=Brachyhypopomus gauderio TaxID=698409 RepID=UPI0040426B8C